MIVINKIKNLTQKKQIKKNKVHYYELTISEIKF